MLNPTIVTYKIRLFSHRIKDQANKLKEIIQRADFSRDGLEYLSLAFGRKLLTE